MGNKCMKINHKKIKIDISKLSPKSPINVNEIDGNYEHNEYFIDEKKLFRNPHSNLVVTTAQFSKIYEFQYQIGHGTSCIVYKCRHRKNNNFVAIKTIEKIGLTEKQLSNVYNECRVSKFIKHENLVKIHETYETPSRVFIVQELCQGQDLFQYCQEFTLSEKDVKWVAMELLKGIMYLKSEGITHRDIKLENVVLNKKNDLYKGIKLIDFGFVTNAIIMHEKMGTPQYVAPEVVQNKLYTQIVDIFSYGVLLYTLVSKNYPFKKYEYTKIQFNQKVWTNISFEFKQYILRCLEYDPKRRFSVEEAFEFLQNLQT
jgi:serine/threonine protein kinase